jgi:hypothetical protein
VYTVGWEKGIKDYGPPTIANSIGFGKWYMERRIKGIEIPIANLANPVYSGDGNIELKRATNP